ncbi:MAG: tRNA lysidine(34) synthetase TilS [Desulfobacterales bacterium]|nr:tRNA lysidine(34) synthetase TilS [Desulfobacterales bacterium]
MQDIFTKVRETLSRYEMIAPKDGIIVALSGGPDSVCLLHVLHELKDELDVRLVVAHYDHGLRPDEDEAETQFTRDLAASLNLPFETEKASCLFEGRPPSLEEKARNARYAFLERVRKKAQAHKIALGHNLNDQAETVIMRLLRGSGPSGLAGIPPMRNKTIIRPLIQVRREEIEAFLAARNLSYVTDSSNLQARYLRNRIRQEVIPLLTSYQPRLVEHLGQMAETLRGENEYLDQIAEDWLNREAAPGPGGELSVPLSAFAGLIRPLRNRVTRRIIKRVKKDLRRISHEHIQSVSILAGAARPQGVLNLPKGMTIIKSYDRLHFTASRPAKAGPFNYSLSGPGTIHLEEIGRTLSIEEMETAGDLGLEAPPGIAYLDADKLQYPLLLRNFRPGDRFMPLGMKGHKKVKAFFADLKIPSYLRNATPILIYRDTPVWICGFRIDERFKVTPLTRKVLKVTIE